MTPTTVSEQPLQESEVRGHQQRLQILEDARMALKRVFSVPGLSDQQRLSHAKQLNKAVQKIEFQTQTAELASWPTFIELPVAGKCNLRCTMCSLSHGAPTYSNWTLEEVKRFEAFFRFATEVNPTGVGEPLSNKDLIPMLGLFHRYQNTVGFYSNGTLLTPEKADALIDTGLGHLNVSIDGATAKTFETIRRHGKFDTVVNNLKHLIKRRQERGAQSPRLHIAMVLMRENIHELPDLVRLAKEIGADSVYAMYVSGIVPDKQCEHEPVETNRRVREAKQVAKELGLPFRAPAELDETVTTPVDVVVAEAKAKPASASCKCKYPWSHYLVHNDGQVGPCCMIRGELDGFSFGNIRDQKPTELWNSPGMIHLRQRFASNDAPDVCRTCHVRSLSIS